MHPRRSAADTAVGFGRRNPHAAEKRAQRDFNSGSKLSHHALTVQQNNSCAGVREVLRQKARPEPESVVGIRNGEIDLLNPDLQGIAGLRALNINRAVQNVAPRTVGGDLFIDIAQVLLDLVRGKPCFFQARRAVGEQRFKYYGVSRLDTQYRLRSSIVIAPRHCLGRGFQRVRRGSCALLRAGVGNRERHACQN